MRRREFLEIVVAGSAVLLLPPRLLSAALLRAGNNVSLRCLGSPTGGFLDGRTGDGSVGLAPSVNPPFSGTKWHVFSGGGRISLKCMGTIEGNRFLVGRTKEGSVGLAPSFNSASTRWKVVPVDPNNPDIVTLSCLGDIPDLLLAGHPENGTVGLSRNRNDVNTRWEVKLSPVRFDNNG